MTIAVGKRLPVETFQLDLEWLRQGAFSDAYFNNTADILIRLAHEGYLFQGKSDLKEVDSSQVETGDVWVEMQFFNSRSRAVIAGVDEALAILQTCTGFYDESGTFINTFDQLQVEAIHDGSLTVFQGDKRHVQPVLKVRGRYRDFARLETPLLGVMARPTRIATQALELCEAANGKEVQFFPARFEHYKMQPWDGYAFWVGVQAYNRMYGRQTPAPVSTKAQGHFWGGRAGGTMPHAMIAAFHGDTVEAMLQFCRLQPAQKNRIALVDFHNDSVDESLAVARALFTEWYRLTRAGDDEQARRFKLFGVRPDTGGGLVDRGLERLGKHLPGVNADLVHLLRQSLDQAYLSWDLPSEALGLARQWCQEIKIVVTGGFSAPKIREFEAQGVPVDIYGVGSAFLINDRETNTDFTADVVRVLVDGAWQDLAKVGRGPGHNPELQRFDLAHL